MIWCDASVRRNIFEQQYYKTAGHVDAFVAVYCLLSLKLDCRLCKYAESSSFRKCCCVGDRILLFHSDSGVIQFISVLIVPRVVKCISISDFQNVNGQGGGGGAGAGADTGAGAGVKSKENRSLCF